MRIDHKSIFPEALQAMRSSENAVRQRRPAAGMQTRPERRLHVRGRERLAAHLAKRRDSRCVVVAGPLGSSRHSAVDGAPAGT